jgi:gliding motility-associated-like protein
MLRYLISILFLFWFGLVVQAQIEFVANKGQWPEQVAFKASFASAALWAEKNALTYLLVDQDYVSNLHGEKLPSSSVPFKAHAYTVHFLNSSGVLPTGQKVKSHYYNYYLDSNPEKWASHVPVFEQCYYQGMYPNVDAQLYTAPQGFKYDFIVHPGGNHHDIRMKYEGVDSLYIQEGNLMVPTSVSTVKEMAPFAYQLSQGRVVEVPCKYVLSGNEVFFEVGEYQRDLDLVIDPEIAFSTLIGSNANNFGFTACNDENANLIGGSAVFEFNYPVTPGAYDATFNGPVGPQFTIAGMDCGISKFSSDGTTLLYSTYFGGSSQETPHSIVVNNDNQFVVMGMTGSLNLPVTTGVYQPNHGGGTSVQTSSFLTGSPMTSGTDFYLVVFNEDGTLAASTYVGGTGNDGINTADRLFYNYGDVFRGEVNVDSGGNIYVAAVSSGDFPVTTGAMQTVYGGGATDGVIFKLNPTLTTLLYSTYVGGTGADACYALQFDVAGNVLVGGGSGSPNFNFPIVGGVSSSFGDIDGFVLELEPVFMNLLSGTFLGTSSYDQVYFVQSDIDGNIYVLGQTEGNMAISPGRYGQPNSGLFIRKYSPGLATMEWNTVVGTGSGEVDISPSAFLVSDCYQIYFSGWGGRVNAQNCEGYGCYALFSTTVGLPITPDAFQSETDGSDFYLAVLSPDASSLVYGSFFGGGLSAEHVDGGTSRFSKDGSVFQAVCAGCQNHDDFPTTPGAYSPVNGSTGCNLGVFRFDLGLAIADIGVEDQPPYCVGTPVQFINNSQNANSFLWSFGDGSTSISNAPVYTFTTPGTYTIRCIAGANAVNCSIPDTAFVTITILPLANPTIDPVNPICSGNSVTLNATGTDNMQWIANPTLNTNVVSAAVASPDQTTTYFLVDSNECGTDTTSIQVQVVVLNTAVSENDSICAGQSVPLTASGGNTYLWSPAVGLNSATLQSPVASPLVSTSYYVTITGPNNCSVQDSVYINVVFNPPGGDIYPDVVLCSGEAVNLQAAPAQTYVWSPSQYVSNPFVQNPSVFPPTSTTFFVDLTNACGTGQDQVTVNVVFPSVGVEGGGTPCLGGSTRATAFGGLAYSWEPANFASHPDSSTTSLFPNTSRYMYVTILDENGCYVTDSVWVGVLPLPQVDAGPDLLFEFPGETVLTGNAFGNQFYWISEDSNFCDTCISQIVSPTDVTIYTLVVMSPDSCVATDAAVVSPIFPLWVPNTITPDNDGINDVFRAVGENITSFHLVITDRWGMRVFESFDISVPWNGGIDGYYVQNDVYIWDIEYTVLQKVVKLRGHVTVIR